MAYEKPKIVDLSSRSEKGFGEGCFSGSGETFNCGMGVGAAQLCDVGGGVSAGSKYED